MISRPDSWLSKEVNLWYDSLYRESDKIDSYDNNPIEDEGLRKYDFSSLQGFLVSVGKDVGIRLLQEACKEAEKAIESI